MPVDYEKASPTATPVTSTEVSPSASKTRLQSPDMSGDSGLVLPLTPEDDPDYGHRVSSVFVIH